MSFRAIAFICSCMASSRYNKSSCVMMNVLSAVGVEAVNDLAGRSPPTERFLVLESGCLVTCVVDKSVLMCVFTPTPIR